MADRNVNSNIDIFENEIINALTNLNLADLMLQLIADDEIKSDEKRRVIMNTFSEFLFRAEGSIQKINTTINYQGGE